MFLLILQGFKSSLAYPERRCANMCITARLKSENDTLLARGASRVYIPLVQITRGWSSCCCCCNALRWSVPFVPFLNDEPIIFLNDRMIFDRFRHTFWVLKSFLLENAAHHVSGCYKFLCLWFNFFQFFTTTYENFCLRDLCSTFHFSLSPFPIVISSCLY